MLQSSSSTVHLLNQHVKLHKTKLNHYHHHYTVFSADYPSIQVGGCYIVLFKTFLWKIMFASASSFAFSCFFSLCPKKWNEDKVVELPLFVLSLVFFLCILLSCVDFFRWVASLSLREIKFVSEGNSKKELVTMLVVDCGRTTFFKSKKILDERKKMSVYAYLNIWQWAAPVYRYLLVRIACNEHDENFFSCGKIFPVQKRNTLYIL